MYQKQTHETDPYLERLKRYVEELGVLSLRHSKRTYWDHLEGIYRDLVSWGCDEALCNAGVFHSIYGTEQFRAFELPLDKRSELQSLIGERAEQIAFLNCFMDRAVFDADVLSGRFPYRIRHRVDQVDIELSPETFDGLCCVHLCDWLETVARIDNWQYRREAYRQLAMRQNGPMKDAYEREMSGEPSTLDPAEPPSREGATE
ncbi:MAG: DUF6817 domain-containing protein [Pseudomonadota bacterium]